MLELRCVKCTAYLRFTLVKSGYSCSTTPSQYEWKYTIFHYQYCTSNCVFVLLPVYLFVFPALHDVCSFFCFSLDFLSRLTGFTSKLAVLRRPTDCLRTFRSCIAFGSLLWNASRLEQRNTKHKLAGWWRLRELGKAPRELHATTIIGLAQWVAHHTAD